MRVTSTSGRSLNTRLFSEYKIPRMLGQSEKAEEFLADGHPEGHEPSLVSTVTCSKFHGRRRRTDTSEWNVYRGSRARRKNTV